MLAPQSKSKRNPADRRRSERRPCIVEAWIASPTAAHPEERAEVTSVNISRHGVAFESRAPLPKGAFYTMEIGFGPQRMIAEIRTIACRDQGDGTFEVGAEFC